MAALVRRFSPHKTIVIDFQNGAVDLSRFGEVVAQDVGQVTLRVSKAEAAQVTGRILAEYPILDLTIQDPPIEEIIEQVFSAPAGAEP